MDTISFLIGRNSAGGGSATTPSWDDVENKPFETIGPGLMVDNGSLQEVVPVYTETTEEWQSMEFYDLINLGSNHFSQGLTDEEASALPATGFDVYFNFYYKDTEDEYYGEFSASLGETHIWDSTYVYENDEWQFNIYLANEDGVKLNIIGQKKNDTVDIISINSCTLSYLALRYIDHTLPGRYVAKDDSTIKANLQGNLYVDTTTILSGYATEDYVDSKVSQSDWAQSITTAPDYVKNRPMYSYQEEGQGELTDTFLGIDYCMANGSNCQWFSAVAMVVESNVNSSNIDCRFEYSWINGEDTSEIVDTFTIPQNADIWNTVTVTGDITGNTYNIWVGLDAYDNDILNITCNATGEYYGDPTSLSLTYIGTTQITKYQPLSPVYVPIDDETIKANGSNKIYVPITPNLTTGVDIASIGGITIYAPAGGGGGSTAWADITGKPSIASSGSSDGVIVNAISGVGSNSATGECAFAGGVYNEATGNYSHAEGSHNSASGHRSHAEGYGSLASGTEAHAEGNSVIASGNCQHAQGKYNVSNDNYATVKFADIIGNGSATNSRSNAEATDWDGNKYLAGDVYVGVSNWATPSLGSAKIPKEADFDWASENGATEDPDSLVESAYNTYENENTTDEYGQDYYLGVYEEWTFIHTSDSEFGESRYIWKCTNAYPKENYNYGTDPEGGGDEPEPDPEEEGEPEG